MIEVKINRKDSALVSIRCWDSDFFAPLVLEKIKQKTACAGTQTARLKAWLLN